MKISYKSLFAMTIIAGLLLLTSCTTPPKIEKSSMIPAARLTPLVRLNVVGNPKKLKVITPGNPNCNPATPVDHRKGCLVVPKTDTALIKFELSESPLWHFKKIQICKGGTKLGMVCTFDLWQENEFYATDANETGKLRPNGSGVIDLSALPGNQTEFYLFDYNSVPQDYFYTITVCNADNSVCPESDPPLENGGRY